MFEARMAQGGLLKKLVDGIKELVVMANFEVSSDGIQLQAMDTSHVCLIALSLSHDGFDMFRCDRPLTLGFNMANLAKLLKAAGNDDIITLKSEDEPDTITLMCESPNGDRVSDFDMKLMEIDAEQMAIPETEHSATVRMPSGEYARICKDLSTIGDAVTLSVTKDGVKLSVSGEVGTANITLRPNADSATKPEQQVAIEVSEPACNAFAIKYFNSFAKASGLSPSVKISLTKDLPIVVEYTLADMGWLRFYLAPKITSDDEDDGEMDDV